MQPHLPGNFRKIYEKMGKMISAVINLYFSLNQKSGLYFSRFIYVKEVD
ncbi:Uncharacterised protein [Klebsiella pneumoniae]|nr:Uncharacterised protein [Klebsiella pneumoniae]